VTRRIREILGSRPHKNHRPSRSLPSGTLFKSSGTIASEFRSRRSTRLVDASCDALSYQLVLGTHGGGP
jgi:hypothetical protein